MSADEYAHELCDIKQNVKNLSECLHKVLNRIEQLEHVPHGAASSTSKHTQVTQHNSATAQIDPCDPNTQKHVHIEESEEQDEDGTKIKRIHVTERVVTTKTFQTVSGVLLNACRDHRPSIQSATTAVSE